MERSMFWGASPEIFERAKRLRANETGSELKLWNYLKEKPLGYKFRRQHPVKVYIADFYCHALKLIIEVDGEVHDTNAVKDRDKNRQQDLEHEGIMFMRFTNKEIDDQFEKVKGTIKSHIESQSSTANAGKDASTVTKLNA